MVGIGIFHPRTLVPWGALNIVMWFVLCFAIAGFHRWVLLK